MSIICLGLNHKSAPVSVRENFLLIEAQALAALKSLHDLPHINEVIILSTCNRTEIYIYAENPALAREQLYSYLFLIHKITAKQINKYFYVLSDANAVKHLLAVAAGLDSLIIGEGQILGQVKQALKYAKSRNIPGAILNNLFAHAVKAGKRVRAETKICRGASSVSFAAVELIKKKFPSLSSLKVLILGTGKMGRQTISFLREHNVKTLYLTNRSYEKCVHFAKLFDGEAVKFENRYDIIKDADIIISSTTSPHFVLTPDRIKQVRALNNFKPLFIIDIAVPRDVDPGVKKIRNITLYNIDDLEEIVKDTLNTRSAEIDEANKIIEKEASEFIQILNAQKVVPFIRQIQNKYHGHLEELLGDIPSEEKEKYKRFGNKLIGRILHKPLTKIKEFSSEEDFIKGLHYLKQLF